MQLLEQEELVRIERDYASGVPAQVIVDIFRPRGVRLSEATFRKYVQAGLLPRSRRVGRKGKHQGSRGLYPVEVVRRINAIKRLMAEGHTLEDIKQSFLVYENHLAALERGLTEALGALEQAVGQRPVAPQRARALKARVRRLRRQGQGLLRAMSQLGRSLSSPLTRPTDSE